MTTTSLLRLFALAILAFIGFSNLHAQDSKVRVKVKVDFDAQPDRELAVAKTVYGDEGSFVALKTLGGKSVIGGIPGADLGWQLFVISSDKMYEVKHDQPKFVWGIGPVAMETIETFNKTFRAILTKPDPDHGKLLLLQQVLSPRSLTRAGSGVAKFHTTGSERARIISSRAWPWALPPPRRGTASTC
ncbi:MAG: hypothetical protein IPH00_14065 [Flavobacteriales bacterium]|nr:hypothetical protein [Flavobacteriales bacterium]